MTRAEGNEIGREERERARLKLFLKYDKCDWCGALPKMPCKDNGLSVRSSSKKMYRPHVSRPLLSEEE